MDENKEEDIFMCPQSKIMWCGSQVKDDLKMYPRLMDSKLITQGIFMRVNKFLPGENNIIFSKVVD